MPRKPKVAQAVEGEHIFPASKLTPLALKWKELSASGRHKEAMLVLEEIVCDSTAMFERLAQHEDFHYTVDLPVLVSAAQEKVVKWLLRWQPKKGRLFSWFSKCAKNAFRSELVKVNQYRKRFHTTSENLEKFYGVDEHEVDKRDLASEVKAKLNDMVCHWGDPQEIGAIRFLIECIIDDEHDRQAAVRGAAYAYGISFELSKFFYDWAITELRHQMYDKIYVPFTEQDLFRAAESYTHLITLLELIGWEATKKCIAVFNGKRIKFPTLNYMAKLKEDYAIYEEIQHSDLDPDSVADVARRHKKTPRSAQEIFEQMSQTLDSRRYGEYPIFEDTNSAS